MATRLLRGLSVAMKAVALAVATLVLLGGCVVGRRPAATAPSPAALPAEAVAPSQRAIGYPHEEFILYGDGTAVSPYAWVWVPAQGAPPR